MSGRRVESGVGRSLAGGQSQWQMHQGDGMWVESREANKWVEPGEGRPVTGGWSQEAVGGVRSGKVSGRWRPEFTDAVCFTVLNI